MVSIFGLGPANQIILVPNKFSNFLLDSNNEDKMFSYKIYDYGVFSQFAQDPNYDLKNPQAPTYLEYMKQKYPYLEIVSQEETIVDVEKALKIEGTDKSTSIKLVIYLILHNREAFNLDYVTNENDFDKYYPEFKEMIESFRFND